MSTTTPNSSTPKSKVKSSVYVSQVTPSPTPASAVSNGNAQNGCLTSSGNYEEDRVNVSFKIAGNGEMNGGGLENSGSSQDTTEVERDRKMTMKGEKGGAGSEEGASQDSGKGDGGASWSGEAAVPKINTISASPQITSSGSTNPNRRPIGHTRASSASSVGSRNNMYPGSSSSSSLSHDSSFASREALIEHLQSELQMASSDSNLSGGDGRSQTSPGARDGNEIITQLLEHIVALKLDLEALKIENRQLKSTRSEMDNELHTLTENLFEEAYKMVDEAKGNKVVAEKKLADAAGKIEAMETEMFALKSLIHNPEGMESSGISDASEDKLRPSSPHKHHHKRHSVKKALKKLTKKAASGVRLGGSGASSSKLESESKQLPPPGKVVPITLVQHKGVALRGATLKEGQLLPSDFAEFSEWLGALSSQSDHAYLDRIIQTDLVPCLTFNNKELSSQVLEAVKENNLIVESVTNCERGRCALSGDEVVCTHRLKFCGDHHHHQEEQWCPISQPCRDRIVAACDFYMCIGHIQKGIMKSDATELYWRVSRLRAMMSLSRLNLHFPEED